MRIAHISMKIYRLIASFFAHSISLNRKIMIKQRTQ